MWRTKFSQTSQRSKTIGDIITEELKKMDKEETSKDEKEYSLKDMRICHRSIISILRNEPIKKLIKRKKYLIVIW